MKLYNISYFELIPDIINFFFLSLFFFFFFKKYKIKLIFFLIAISSLTLPFILYWFWDWSYLPDQSKYANSVYNLRNFNFVEIEISYLTNRVSIASLLMALFPVPFVTTIISISIINKGFLLISIFLFLKNKIIPNALIFLLLLSPSYLVISSVALRDLLVVLSGIFFAYYFFAKKIFKTIFFLILFFLLKPHLAVYFMFVLLVYYWFFYFNIKLINKIIISIFFIILLFFFMNEFWYIVQKIRYGFIQENFNYTYINKNIIETTTIILFLKSFIKFLFLPIEDNIFTIINLIIFLENYIYLFFLIFYLTKVYKDKILKAMYWIVILLFSFTIAGYLIENPGTLWRYKIVLQSVLLFSIYFSLNNNFKKNNQSYS